MLDADELAYIENLVDNYEKEYLESIKNDIVDLFRNAVQKALYDYYNPVLYNRQYRLLDNIRINLKEDNSLFVYVDVLDVGYTSAVTGDNIGDMLDVFVFEGHNSNSSTMNEYEHFEPRLVLQTAQRFIRQKYPDLEVHIIDSKTEI